MPVNPNVLERLVLFRLHRAPAPVLDLFGAAGFEGVTLALEMGVFEALADDPATPGALAERVDADERGTTMLLRFLDAQGYVTSTGGEYRVTKMTERWLLESSERNFGPWLTFWNELVFPFWNDTLEAAVREGEPPETLYEWLGDDGEQWAIAQAGFRAAASVVVEEVGDKLHVPDGATRLLDVGGGHGLFSVRLCERHPELTATVFDVPPALDAARAEVAAADLEDRVSVRGGDYETDDLGTGYDLVLLFNVVHAHDEAEVAALFERARAALAPGGRLVVLDQLEGSARSPVGRAGLTFVGLTYLVTLGARTYSFERLRGMLEAVGFDAVERTSIRRAGPGNALVSATNPT